MSKNNNKLDKENYQLPEISDKPGFRISLKTLKPFKRIVQLYFINVTEHNIVVPSAYINSPECFQNFVIFPHVSYSEKSTKFKIKSQHKIQSKNFDTTTIRPGELVKSDIINLSLIYNFDNKQEYKVKFVVNNYVEYEEGGKQDKIFGDHQNLMSNDIVLPSYPPLSTKFSKRILKFSKKS